MKIREYKIIHNEINHPILWEAHTYNWGGKDFLSYDNIVKMMNSCFKMNRLNEEYTYVLGFDWGLNLKGVFEVSHGTTSSSTMNKKELYTFLLLSGTDRYVVIHNHPSGSLVISEQDYLVTDKVEKITEILKIEMIDSIIISNKGYKLIINNEDAIMNLPKLIDEGNL